MPGEQPLDSLGPVPRPELCGDFQRGNCFRGAECRFEHRIAGTAPEENFAAQAIAAAAIAQPPAIHQQLSVLQALANIQMSPEMILAQQQAQQAAALAATGIPPWLLAAYQQPVLAPVQAIDRSRSPRR